MDCEAACPDDAGCIYDCLSQVYQCNGWSMDCWNACDAQYDKCMAEADNGLELADCVEQFVDCTIPCRESSGDDDDVQEF